jgi:hypothetical protein
MTQQMETSVRASVTFTLTAQQVAIVSTTKVTDVAAAQVIFSSTFTGSTYGVVVDSTSLAAAISQIQSNMAPTPAPAKQNQVSASVLSSKSSVAIACITAAAAAIAIMSWESVIILEFNSDVVSPSSFERFCFSFALADRSLTILRVDTTYVIEMRVADTCRSRSAPWLVEAAFKGRDGSEVA